jgi:gas vesicle protein
MFDHRGFGVTHLITAFIAGAASGAALALLTAPRSGEASRKQLRDLLFSTVEDAGRIPHALSAAVAAAAQAFAGALHTEMIPAPSCAVDPGAPQTH